MIKWRKGNSLEDDEREDGEALSEDDSDTGSVDTTDSVKIMPTRRLSQQEEFEQDMQALQSNPAFGTFIKKLVAEEIQEASRQGQQGAQKQ